MEPLIRSFEERDRDALVALWTVCELTRPWNDPNRDIDRKLARDAEGLLVLEVDGDIVGSVMVGYDGHRGWLNYLAVRPDHQRQGWARRLMSEAERRLLAMGCAKVNLQVRAENAGAIEFYAALGFATDEVVSLGKRLERDESAHRGSHGGLGGRPPISRRSPYVMAGTPTPPAPTALRQSNPLHRRLYGGAVEEGVGMQSMDDHGRTFLDATMPHLDAIYRVARHACGDHGRAEDLVQETYLRAFSAFDQQRGPSVRAWLVTICLNLARSEGRRRSRRVVEAPMRIGHEPPSLDPAVVDVAIANVDRDGVDRALARLPEDQRVAIVLMDLIGHSASEIATMLECSRNTVLSRAFRGRKRLMALLVEEGVHHGLS